MDFEEVANYSNMTFNEHLRSSLSVAQIAQEVIFTIFVGIGIILNVTAIYTINYFKKLRTVTNVLFSNWALADTLSLLSNPGTFRIISVIDGVALTPKFICIIMQIDVVFHSVSVLFISIISIDWCIGSYFQNAIANFRKCCKFLVAAIWCLSLITCIITIRLCLRMIGNHAVVIFLIVSYMFSLILVIILHIFRHIQKFRKISTTYPTLMLIIATTYTFCWCVGFTNFLILDFYDNFIAFIFECTVFFSSIINFILMYKYNKDFQACLIQLLKRPRNRYNENITEFDVLSENSNVSSQ